MIRFFVTCALYVSLTGLFIWPGSALTGQGERLNAEIPAEWVQLLDRQAGDLYVAEYYPPEDVAILAATENGRPQWQRKLSIEVLASKPLPDPLIVAGGLVETQAETCDEFSEQGIFAGFENGYPTTVHMLQCPRSKGTERGFLTMIKVIKGNEGLYTITRIWRTAASDIPPPPPPGVKEKDDGPLIEVQIDMAEVGAWANTLRSFSLCDDSSDDHKCD